MDARPDIELGDRPILIGRDYRCDVRFDSQLVSQFHCCLALLAGGIAVQDLGSTNGTRINDLRIAEGFLNVGDVLTVARHRFRFEVHGVRPQDRP